jgi:polyferredoxin
MVILFPVVYYYLSPYLIIAGASRGIVAGDVLLFAGLFASSLFLGRTWCGWLCPGGATQELCLLVNNKSFNGKKRNLIKFLIWIPWLAVAVSLFVEAGGIKSVDPLYQTWNGISVQNLPSAVMFMAIAGAIVAFALVAGKRAACHSVCWMAPFMVIGVKIKSVIGYPSLHLEVDKNRCLKCRMCTSKCPMSLDVAEMVQNENMTNTECILCGSCVDSCPRKVIKYSFS